MLPVLISEGADISVILKIIGIKLLIGMITGIIIDLFGTRIVKGKKRVQNEENGIASICEHEHCHCEEGIFKSSLRHTVNIFIFILLISLALNLVIFFIGEETLGSLLSDKFILGPIVAGIIGIIPNCASSVIITKLYLEGVLSSATMIAGLLVNSGVGLLVLFKVNHNFKQNMGILTSMYCIGVFSGIILEIIGLNI